MGEAWQGDGRSLLKRIPDASVDLIFTSPPYALLKKKAYGNQNEQDYVRWFRPFAKQFHRILKDTGSLVINLGNTWISGEPVRSLYPYRLLLDLCDPPSRRSTPPFYLAQEFFWWNPAKMPNPAQWVTRERIRVKDAVEPIWWLSKTTRPHADNKQVLVPYSEHMKRLLKTQRYNTGRRPSGWNVSEVWGIDNGGAIPPNLLVDANTSSSDAFRRNLRNENRSAHPAMFPPGLPDFFIRLLTDKWAIVLDPFCGSNTTGAVAEDLKRQWLSIDLDLEYLENSKLRWPDRTA